MATAQDGSIVVTSNRAFEQRGEILGDAMVAGALIDRLVHYATVVTGKISLQAISVTTTIAQLAGSDPLGMLSAASSNADVRRSLTERSVASD